MAIGVRRKGQSLKRDNLIAFCEQVFWPTVPTMTYGEEMIIEEAPMARASNVQFLNFRYVCIYILIVDIQLPTIVLVHGHTPPKIIFTMNGAFSRSIRQVVMRH